MTLRAAWQVDGLFITVMIAHWRFGRMLFILVMRSRLVHVRFKMIANNL